MTDRKGESTQVNITGNERPSFAWQDGYSAHSSVNSRDVARFWAKVRQAPNGCWEWTASRMGGRDRKLYGQFTVTVDGKQRSEEHTSELQSQSNLVCRLLL